MEFLVVSEHGNSNSLKIQWNPNICSLANFFEIIAKFDQPQFEFERITEIVLHSATFTVGEFRNIVRLLKSRGEIGELKASLVQTTIDIAYLSNELMNSPCILRELDLRYDYMSCLDIETLSLHLQSQKCTLERLDLSFQQFEIKGFRAFCCALSSNKSLRFLGLVNCLRKDFAVLLAECLKRNHTLRELSIGLNMIEEQGFEAIAEMLCENQIMQRLDLDKSFIGFKSWELESTFVAKIVAFNYSLLWIRMPNSMSFDFLSVELLEQGKFCKDFESSEIDRMMKLSKSMKRNREKLVMEVKFEIGLLFYKHSKLCNSRKRILEYNLVGAISKMLI
jgi:hypothetical protein